MRIECAWCGKHLGGPKVAKAGQVSHGICLTDMFLQSPLVAMLYVFTKRPQGVRISVLSPLSGRFSVLVRSREVLACAA